MRALLEVDDLSVRFPTPRGVVHAVDRITLQVQAGETLGLVGESGSGKSVLARTAMGLVPPGAVVSGGVSFDGQDLRSRSDDELRRLWGRDLAMVFQDPATSLNPVLRIGRQLTEVLELHLGLRGAEAEARAADLLDQVGIPDARRRLRAHAHELSGGMRQRVCIALALACGPRLLFADEPTTALDVTVQRQILDLLASLQEQHGLAVVLVSHDLGVIARRTDRVVVLYGGHIVESGSTASVFDDVRHPYTAALLAAIPRLHLPSHAPLATLPGRPVDVVDPSPGCRFAPRCPAAQDRCRREDPVLEATDDGDHQFACFYPLPGAR